MKTLLFLFFFALTATFSQGQVRLPKIFGDNMVLQREKPINVWGWSSPKEKVTVNFHNQNKTATAGKDGKWKLALDKESAGGPYDLNVSAKSGTVTYKNVLVGEVWICSGQSNMEWPVQATDNAEKAIASATNSNIRHIKIPNTVASMPMDDIKEGVWEVCSPTSVADFTAVGYFFAEKISKELNVPVGLINTSWGGTHSETWTSREGFESSDEFKSMIAGMPKLDLEKIAKEKEQAMATRLSGIQDHYPPTAQEVSSWSSFDFDDSKWSTMNIPETWESQSWPDLDGTVWLRKPFDLSKDDAGKEATLWVAMIDDEDDTYINGAKVGSTQGWNKLREYKVGAGVLKQGKNVIVVRAYDGGGGGGIHGESSTLHMMVGQHNVPLDGTWKYHIESVKGTSAIGPNDYPTLLYNAMISPLIPYTIEGALWYQGEANADRAYQYRTAFPLMITDWRKHWNQGDFPFYFVQLASWNADDGNSEKGSSWAELREAQASTLSLPNTGMAITIDIGNREDIHPRNKLDVGQRLAAVALAKTYGSKVVDRGPTATKLNGMYVEFANTGSGLMVKDKYGYVRGFEVAGSDGKFYPAQAFIEGNRILLKSDKVKDPTIVHYGWADDAGECNLYNKEGFPAEPFRIGDESKFITKEHKFTLD
jgi:sialate O-acetylesterase